MGDRYDMRQEGILVVGWDISQEVNQVRKGHSGERVENHHCRDVEGHGMPHEGKCKRL